MKIKLIAPAWRDRMWKDDRPLFPPLSLAVVAALTPAGADVVILDEGVEEIDYDEPVDMVGITAMTAAAPRAYAIGDEFRRRGVPVVLGGMHPSAVPEEALVHADAVVVGEAEEVWPGLVRDCLEGRMRRLYRGNGRPSLSGLPRPRRDLFRKGSYLIPNTVQTTRGCPFACSFCAVSKFFGHSYRFRPVQEVVAELEEMSGQHVVFVDDNIVGNPGYAKELFKAITPLGIRWFSQGSLNMAEDAELLDLAARSGCMGMFIGFESLTPANLKDIRKGANHVQRYRDAIDRIHSHGIAIEGAFIFGLDHDTRGVFEETIRFAKENRLEAAQFGILTPLPGTDLYRRLEEENRITSRDWAKYNIANVVFKPKNMSTAVLQEGFKRAWLEFYSYTSILYRLGLARKHGSFLWALNMGFHERVMRLLQPAAGET